MDYSIMEYLGCASCKHKTFFNQNLEHDCMHMNVCMDWKQRLMNDPVNNVNADPSGKFSVLEFTSMPNYQ